MINDVQIWAGAYVIDVNKDYEEIKKKSKICNMINGRLNNLWSKNDTTLAYGLTHVYPGQRAVGTYAIFQDIKEEDKSKTKEAHNHELVCEHVEYGKEASVFLKEIKYCY